MAVKFQNTAGSSAFEMRNPEREDTLSINLGQVVSFTADGQPLAYALGATRRRVRLRFGDVPDAEKALLDAFFEDEAEGAKTLFYYRDHRGAWHDARFLSGAIEWTCLADAAASSGEYAAGGTDYPTTTRTDAWWATDIELWLADYSGGGSASGSGSGA